ncbi:MAG: tetratricopeptide repeat protein [Roseibacillus sp.]
MANDETRLTTFHTACWVLGLIAFIELAAVGMALGLQRPQAVEATFSQPQIVEKEVIQYRTLPAEKETIVVEKPIYLEAEVPPLPAGPPLDYQFDPPQKLTLRTPPIASPIVELLVEESRNLRIAGDSMRAMLKLEEAAKTAPEDANVLYQFAEVFSTMGLYDRAADHYQKVFELGTTGAGSLYEMAAIKLRDGIEEPEDMATKFKLGIVRVYRDTTWENGERVILTIPVSAASDLGLNQEELNRALLVQVNLYDELQGRHRLRDEITSSMDTQWVTPPVDWQDGGEELLRVIYEIPSQDDGTSHLLGQRKYFGQVVELFYESALIDRLASPRRLAKEVAAPGEEVYFYPENYVPDDFNFENPLLPPLP